MPLARTLHASLTKHEPEAEFVLFLADEVPAEIDLGALPFEVFEAKRLGIDCFADMAFRYDIMEFNTAIKPFCFLHLMDRVPQSRVIYLDPDIYVTASLQELQKRFDQGAELILTPHALAPLDDGYDPDDQRIMQTGAYNLGFAGMADSEDVRLVLHWWADHMRTRCISNLPKGLFVDQKFMDMAPAFVEQTHILRHRGFNAAYWNLHERPIVKTEEGYTAGADPLVFFHFSGIDRNDPDVFSRHQNRFSTANIGDARVLLEEYSDQLLSHDDQGWHSIDYAYSRFVSGSKIPDVMRRVYRSVNIEPKSGSYTDIFALDLDLYNSPSEDLQDHSGAPISRLMHEIWRMRTDLRAIFNLTREQDRVRFADWYRKDAIEQCGLPEGAVPGADLQARELAAQSSASPDRGSREVDPSLPAAVSVVGYLNAESGIGEAVRTTARAMEIAGLSVVKHTLRAEGFANLERVKEDIEQRPARVLYLHVNADRTLSTIASLSPSVVEGRYRIGYWAWELGYFPDAWDGAIDAVDEIWVPSQFVAEAIRRKTKKPVTLIPHPVAIVPGDREAGRQAIGVEDPETMVITSVFDTRSFIKRKNPLGAIEAFRRAFHNPRTSNVVLVLKSHGPITSGLAQKVYAEAARTPGVVVRHEVFSADKMADLREATDILFSPHRSEGFGLNIAEAMASGKVVLATGWSGNTDFMTSTNSVSIDYDLRPLAPGDYPFAQNQVWAEPNLDHAAQQLVMLRTNPDARRTLGEFAQHFIAGELSTEAIGKRAKERIQEIFLNTAP